MVKYLINKSFKKLRAFTFRNFKRTLPLNELYTDRWEKARYLGFGEGASIYDSSIVFGEVSVGKNTWIGPYTVLDGSGGLEIGANCSISTGVQIYSHDTVNWALSNGREPYDYAKTTIKNNCYIGPNVIVAKGVIIGEFTVVGANSFVNRSLEGHKKYAGSPVKEIVAKI
ncbi:MAG: acyltransferase [Bacteroidetes bacterium]|nr:acyltransferase [Bacteroidota bacterium]MBU1371229.1 acyltransferase [Bacteroidota bacterium]MBU1483806.1 acyltransferase [Bacteroidota bacterium]MBU1760044.1 acyltransferase [Bacteroidota bacterium]MBU2266768.1 acyltransferase [Bacteroidota bacterium]